MPGPDGASREQTKSPRRHVAETRLVLLHPRPIQTIQSVSTQACDSVCRLWPDNAGFPASDVRKSHSPQPLHPDWEETIFTQSARHFTMMVVKHWKKLPRDVVDAPGRWFYSSQPTPVMVENIFSYLSVEGTTWPCQCYMAGSTFTPAGVNREEQRRKFMLPLLSSIPNSESLHLTQALDKDKCELWPPHVCDSISHTAQICSQGRAHWSISPACTSGHWDMGGGSTYFTHWGLSPTWKEAARST